MSEEAERLVERLRAQLMSKFMMLEAANLIERQAARRWPRFMIRSTACEYVSLSAAAFEREIIAGKLPSSVMLGGKPHWCKSQLDSYLDRLAGSGEGNWREALPIYQRLGRGA